MNFVASRNGNNSIIVEQQLNLILTKEIAKDYLAKLGKQCLVKVERQNVPFEQSGVSVKRHCESRSAEHGYIHYDIINRMNAIMTIEQYLPWHMTVYTYKLPKNIRIELQQSISRKLGTVIRLQIPPQTQVKNRRISLEYDLLLLKYTEYPIDPHRGLDIAPAKVIVFHNDATTNNRKFWTTPSLVRMPVPDFSMPYNVITITCTLLALFHGQLYNRLTRRFSLLPEDHKDKLLKRILENAFLKLKSLL